MGVYNISSNDKILQEVYLGETKDIKELQDILSRFRSRCFKERSLLKAMNTYDELYEFNRKAEDTWGFKAFSLSIAMGIGLNACTIPISCNIDASAKKLKNSYKTSKTNYKYSKEDGFTCIVFLNHDLLMDPRFTDREILAVILHEVGHNFATTFDPASSIFSSIQSTVLVINNITNIIKSVITLNPQLAVDAAQNTLLTINKSRKALLKLEEKIKKEYSGMWIFIDTCTRFYNIMRNLLLVIGKMVSNFELVKILLMPLEVVLNLILAAINAINTVNPILILINYFKYSDEKAADSFCALYGYGPEQASCLAKLTYSDEKSKLYKTCPIIPQFFKVLCFIPELIISGADAHPDTCNRMKSELTYLKQESERSDLDPKVKKEINKQVKQLEALIDKTILKPAREKDMSDPQLIKKLYNASIYDALGGDYREILYGEGNMHDKLDRAYNKKLNEVTFI